MASQIIDSPGELGSNGAVAMARKLAADDPRYVLPDQYANPDNPRAHYETTGAEILADCPDLDVFVAGLGTGGTLMGVGRRLREEQSGRARRRCRANARRAWSRACARLKMASCRRSSTRPSSTSATWSRPRNRSRRCARLTATEAIFAGVSSGGVLAVASRVAETMESGTIVALLADGGWKYLSEDLWRRDPTDDELEALNLW